MIKNLDSNLYTGVTDNPLRRLSEHNNKQGSKFTKSKSLFEIVFLEQYLSFSDARKREIQIKKWRREKKEILIQLYKKEIDTRLKTKKT